MNNTFENQSQPLPENLVARVWQELIRATKDKRHAWKRPAFASIGLDGNPQVRTIVLRHANQSLSTLDAYTDLRSPKCQEISKCNRAQLAFWSERLSWQLRVSVDASIHRHGDLVDSAWASVSQSKSSKDYLGNQAPGSLMSLNKIDDEFHSEGTPNHHLAVLSFKVISMDWLELGKDLHRRAQINLDGTVTALNP